MTAFAGFSLLVLFRGCSDEGQLSPLSSAPIASGSPTASSTLSSSTPKPKPVERFTDDNPVPFPTESGYLEGYPTIELGGYPSVTVPIALSSLSASPTSSSTPKPKLVRRPADDNPVPFPTKSGYLKGYPALSVGGYSSVTVDNSQNDSDVFVKLFWLDTTPSKPVRVFFIRAHDTFTVENIKPGNYDVRYRDLTSRALSRTEQFNLKEVRTATGVQFSKLRLTLYKVLDGNMITQPISESEF